MTRAQARALRKALDPAARRAWSEAIVRHVLAWDAYVRADTVMAYASTGSEVDTWPLLEHILRCGKRLLLPRCLGRGEMAAMEVSSLAQLAPGTLGILEPRADARITDKRAINLILAPGLLFDGQGNRLGQGGGYYDRYLAGYGGTVCGVAFAAQIVDTLDTRPHDRPVGWLATENGVAKAVARGDLREDGTCVN